jgi:NADH-quinone oxidoreductase subunit K
VWILLKAEFLAITLVLVYVGAVMVLFLFVVMMLDINMDSVARNFWKHFPLAATVGALIALEMAAVLMGGFRIADEPRAPAAVAQVAGQAVEQYSNTKELGKLLYTVSVPAGNCCRHPAGGHDRRHRADPARAQGQQTHGPFDQVRVKCERPFRGGEARRHAAPLRNLPPRPPRRKRHDTHPWTLPFLGAILFALSVIGIFLNRKNLIVLLMAIELMLLAVNMNFVAFSHYLGDMHGQVFVFFILTVAAAESAIGLAILVLLFRNKSSINVDELNTLKG